MLFSFDLCVHILFKKKKKTFRFFSLTKKVYKDGENLFFSLTENLHSVLPCRTKQVDKICPYKDGKGHVKIIEKIVDNTSYSYLAFASYHKSNLVYKCFFLLILRDHKHARIFLYIKFLRICKIPCPACMPIYAGQFQ